MGVMFQKLNRSDEAESRLASIAAAEIISHFGARPKVQLSSVI